MCLWRIIWRLLKKTKNTFVSLLLSRIQGYHYQRDDMGWEVGRGFRIGNSCTPVADSIYGKTNTVLWYIYTMEYYSAIKKNKFESVLMRWMKLELIIQRSVI